MARRTRRRGQLPLPESPRRLLLIRSVSIAALAVTGAYLVWRALFTVNLGAWYIGVPMLALEVHAAIGLGLFAFSLWDVDRRPARRAPRRRPRIAVLIPTYNEGPEILVPTVAAATALEPVHETWLLDDGNRPEVAELAEALGARYLARPTHEHAKAGNLNHALGVVDADIIAVLDADHVASPDFLAATIGYFDDARVALVQTPQDFYNVTSFEHGSGTAYGQPFHEQSLFYRLLQPGKNRWNAAFWCGTGALVRVAALREVGGAATDTITEDIHTTIRLHRRGWKTVYHNEVLARGLAADDAAQYQLQRNRWGTGAMQVLRVENPFVIPGLTLGQRLAYAATLLGWFDSWRTLGFLLLPPLVLLTGQIPIIADGATFAAAFATTYLLQQAALYLLGRGAYRPVLSIIFDLVRMPPNFIATLTLFTARTPTFRVTPKGRVGTDRGRIEAPAMLRFSLAISFVAATVYSLHLLGLFEISYDSEWAALGAFGWLSVNVALVWIAIRRIRSLRFATQRRSAVRFAVDLPGWIDGQEAAVLDVSVGGTLIATLEPLVDRDTHLVSFGLPGVAASLWARIRSTRRAPSGEYHYALEFEPGQYAARGALARTIFAGRYPVAGTVPTPWPDLLRREIGGLSDRFGQRVPQRRPQSPVAVSASVATPVVNAPAGS
ncbi:MAG TPA: cellulose synthase catalytic subunit [Candidatus Limnocylindria bacterium]|nr:cellulose synthase catalytic subunit [Candidatus Limnocylindria bacterium]